MTSYRHISSALWLPILFLICGAGFSAFAQDADTLSRNAMILRALAADASQTPETDTSQTPETDTLQTQKADTLYCDKAIKMDSTLVGKTIFDVLPTHSKGDTGNVIVNQDYALQNAFQRHITESGFKEINGYRIRIYFSNAQNAREASMAAAWRFQSHFEGHNVYRQFVNPNFKVTVGDFRTKSEALAFLDAVRADFPAAFIVREKIHYTY